MSARKKLKAPICFWTRIWAVLNRSSADNWFPCSRSLDRRAFAATLTEHASSLDSIDFSRSREPDSTLCRRQQACSYTLPQRPPRHIYNPTIARPLPPPALFFEASKQNSPRPRSPSCPPNREALRGGPRFLKLPSNDPQRPHSLYFAAELSEYTSQVLCCRAPFLDGMEKWYLMFVWNLASTPLDPRSFSKHSRIHYAPPWPTFDLSRRFAYLRKLCTLHPTTTRPRTRCNRMPHSRNKRKPEEPWVVRRPTSGFRKSVDIVGWTNVFGMNRQENILWVQSWC